MPANKKYLTSSPIQRIAKISAGFVGGYVVTETFHIMLMTFFNIPNVIMTLRFFGFIMWAVLMILAFLAKSAWKIWALYTLVSLLFIIVIYLNNPNQLY
ncbi:hypothetical protein NH341_12555 [Tenacibaculum sp. XPcli2-G]|nr:hypothetical protein [Tenacibaculum sp. XPcli2-G]MCO7186250.1 hypothetical protein [Tenacibaculum sp. XPcli2-G]